ncbi:hypothetical protein [Mycobacteroides abscessus]|uniref:hypothetical protein n=1 Tax=Mycobacteroides abscessus TaxID=36809 RepID=UPI0012FFF9AD|nr:hypothetical protein [Mycobacteroides abscessus]
MLWASVKAPEILSARLEISYDVGSRIKQTVSVGVTSLQSVQIGVYNATDQSGSLVTNESNGTLKIEYADFSMEDIVAGVKKPVYFQIQHLVAKCPSSTHAVDTTYQYRFGRFAPHPSGDFTPSSFPCQMRNWT